VERNITRGLVLLMVAWVSGCMTTNTPKPEDTKLYKTWSNVFLVEMGNTIVNHDFEAFVFYMSEYEESLEEENKRSMQFLEEGDDITRFGDINHPHYLRATMHMCSEEYQLAYFYLTRYMDVLENRFLYNQDWKPIPDFAK